MFDTYRVGPRSIDVQHVEKRAPTDESVRLLREMEAAAKTSVVESMRLTSNKVEAIVHRHQMMMDMRTVFVIHYAVNGEKRQGFARWASEHRDELLLLGHGRHWGEWWGAGIQRRYGLTEKRFSLFNSARWSENKPPPCVSVVPVLYTGIFTSTAADDALDLLRREGSKAAPGFMKPEGIIIYQSAAHMYFKKTLDKDEEWKGKQAIKTA